MMFCELNFQSYLTRPAIKSFANGAHTSLFNDQCSSCFIRMIGVHNLSIPFVNKNYACYELFLYLFQINYSEDPFLDVEA